MGTVDFVHGKISLVMIGSVVKCYLLSDDTHDKMFCCMTTYRPASACAPLQLDHRGDAAAFSVCLCACMGCGLGILLWPLSGGLVEIR